MSAKIEEVIVDADPFDPEQLFPDVDNFFFRGTAWRNVRRRQIWTCMLRDRRTSRLLLDHGPGRRRGLLEPRSEIARRHENLRRWIFQDAAECIHTFTRRAAEFQRLFAP